MTEPYDLAVIGGGIMGCEAAIRAAAGGMRVLLIEEGEIGSGASSANAGTLSLQIKRVALMPYALKGHAIWEEAGDAVGFRKSGGLTLAFTEREADLLETRMAMKREAGAPITMLRANEARAREPGLSTRLLAASWCPEDGFANSSLTGSHYRALLAEAGVDVRTGAGAAAIEPGFVVRAGATYRANRLLLATGAWLAETARMLDIELPVRARINTVSVTERSAPVVGTVIGHATGLLTLKQKPNGTVLIGGGWQGEGDPATGPGQVRAATLKPNLRLAAYALPALARTRLLRSWTGYEANTPDFYPLAGAMPQYPGLFVLGCVRGGYTIGPYIGRLMGDLILDREPEMPLFDPARFN